MARIKFMNTNIDNLTMAETLHEIDKLIQKKNCSYVVTPNVDHIVRLEKDEELQKVYKNASLILTDGKPLIWISKWYKTPIKEKISGSDLFPKVCELAANKNYTMYLLGAAEGVADTAARNLMKKYPGLNIVGTYSPPFGFEKNEQEMNKIKTQIQEVHPDILIVGLGASIDFEAGNIKRAPKWMSNHGLEWLYRFSKEPKRLFKRYFVDDLKIIQVARKYR